MVETWVLWLFVVGVAIGIVVTLVAVVRLPRGEADVSDQERHTEATWISDIIERHGGVAPVLLVEEVLELHQAYLRVARPPVPPRNLPGGPVLPPAWVDPWAGPPAYPTVPPGPPPAGYPAAPQGPPAGTSAATPPRPR